MNGSHAEVVHAPVDDLMHKHMAGELMSEVIGSLAVIALAIAGLAGAAPAALAAVATIILGAALLIQGGAFTGMGAIERGEWTTTGFLAGVTGIVLGIIAFFSNWPGTLIGAAMIVFGATLLLSHWMEGEFGGRALVGLGATVLGILAVVGLAPQLTLVLVALLALGTMELMSGLQNRAVYQHGKHAV